MADLVAGKKLTAQQRKTIECLMLTGSISEAALASGVSRNAIYKWHKQPDFVEALAEAEAEAVQSLSRVLAGLGDSAAAALKDALDAKQKITVRLRAAEIVTDRLLKIRELVDLEQRLAALEQQR